MADEPVQELKRRLSPRLLALPGVTGVGVPGGRLTVYLERESPQARNAVAALLAQEAPGATYDFLVTGAFEKR